MAIQTLIFSFSQALEISRQYLLLRSVISQKLRCVPLTFASYVLFTWREEDPSTRRILEDGITLRWVYMQKFRPVSCPSREG